MTAIYPTVPKAFIYVARRSPELLLLAHPVHPEAGLQVPAGTIMPEDPRAAGRELAEETGPQEFEIARFLGERVHDMRPFGKNEPHHRYFFQVTLTGEAPE